jgi:hypothetical protein
MGETVIIEHEKMGETVYPSCNSTYSFPVVVCFALWITAQQKQKHRAACAAIFGSRLTACNFLLNPLRGKDQKEVRPFGPHSII